MDLREIEIRLRAEGWVHHPSEGFIATGGGIWIRGTNSGTEYGLLSKDMHRNRNAVVHGGALMTFADRALGSEARNAAPIEWATTVSLSFNFLAPLEIGMFASIRPRVEKLTRNMAFMAGTIIAEGDAIATAQGIWKIRRS